MNRWLRDIAWSNTTCLISRTDPTDNDGPPITGYRPLPTLRAEPAALINASVDELALTQNATMGMSFLANGLDLERGDEIVTTDQEGVRLSAHFYVSRTTSTVC